METVKDGKIYVTLRMCDNNVKRWNIETPQDAYHMEKLMQKILSDSSLDPTQRLFIAQAVLKYQAGWRGHGIGLRCS